RPLTELGEAAARARARLHEPRKAEREGVAVRRGRDGVLLGPGVGALGDVAGHARIERERRDDALAILQLEQLLDGLAVARRGGDVDDSSRVRRAEVREEDDALAGRANLAGEHRVALAEPRRGRILDLLLALHPAIDGEQDVVVFRDDELFFRELRVGDRPLDPGAARAGLAEALRELLELSTDERPAPARGRLREQAADLLGPLALVLELLLDDEDLEARQAVELELEDGVRLLRVEVEALHDLLRGVGLALRLADDAQDLIERVEDLLEALEDVDAPAERVELVLEPPGHDLEAEV